MYIYNHKYTALYYGICNRNGSILGHIVKSFFFGEHIRSMKMIKSQNMYTNGVHIKHEHTSLFLPNPFLLYPTVSRLFSHFDHFTDGRTPWTSDQLVARPLPKHRTTQTRNKHLHIRNIHALCGIRTQYPGFRASEDST
jgi:hypothetical protein